MEGLGFVLLNELAKGKESEEESDGEAGMCMVLEFE